MIIGLISFILVIIGFSLFAKWALKNNISKEDEEFFLCDDD